MFLHEYFLTSSVAQVLDAGTHVILVGFVRCCIPVFRRCSSSLNSLGTENKSVEIPFYHNAGIYFFTRDRAACSLEDYGLQFSVDLMYANLVNV